MEKLLRFLTNQMHYKHVPVKFSLPGNHTNLSKSSPTLPRGISPVTHLNAPTIPSRKSLMPSHFARVAQLAPRIRVARSAAAAAVTRNPSLARGYGGATLGGRRPRLCAESAFEDALPRSHVDFMKLGEQGKTRLAAAAAGIKADGNRVVRYSSGNYYISRRGALKSVLSRVFPERQRECRRKTWEGCKRASDDPGFACEGALNALEIVGFRSDGPHV